MSILTPTVFRELYGDRLKQVGVSSLAGFKSTAEDCPVYRFPAIILDGRVIKDVSFAIADNKVGCIIGANIIECFDSETNLSVEKPFISLKAAKTRRPIEVNGTDASLLKCGAISLVADSGLVSPKAVTSQQSRKLTVNVESKLTGIKGGVVGYELRVNGTLKRFDVKNAISAVLSASDANAVVETSKNGLKFLRLKRGALNSVSV